MRLRTLALVLGVIWVLMGKKDGKWEEISASSTLELCHASRRYAQKLETPWKRFECMEMHFKPDLDEPLAKK
jgi:hypothetical protein